MEGSSDDSSAEREKAEWQDAAKTHFSKWQRNMTKLCADGDRLLQSVPAVFADAVQAAWPPPTGLAMLIEGMLLKCVIGQRLFGSKVGFIQTIKDAERDRGSESESGQRSGVRGHGDTGHGP